MEAPHCVGRECLLGLSLADFSILHTLSCFSTVIVLFLVHWFIFFNTFGLVRHKHAFLRWALGISVVGSWVLGWWYLQPRHPYWINELCVMTWIVGAWHMADMIMYPCASEHRPATFGRFLLHYALALRPQLQLQPQADRPSSDRPSHMQSGQHATSTHLQPHAQAAGRHHIQRRSANGTRNGQGAAAHAHNGLGSSSGACTGAGRSDHNERAADAQQQQDLRKAPPADAGIAHSGTQKGSVKAGPVVGVVASRRLVQRLTDAAPVLCVGLLQYCGCEALNAWLMCQDKDAVLHGPSSAHTLVASVVFATALFLHLSYFFSSMQLLGIVVFGQTREEWPPAFHEPWLSSGPEEFWNERYHQMFRWWFARLVFLPTRRALGSLLGPKASASPAGRLAMQAVPVVAVFIYSGLFHETVTWVFFGQPTWHQFCFFLVHVAALLLQRGVRAVAGLGGTAGRGRHGRQGGDVEPHAHMHSSHGSRLHAGGQHAGGVRAAGSSHQAMNGHEAANGHVQHSSRQGVRVRPSSQHTSSKHQPLAAPAHEPSIASEDGHHAATENGGYAASHAGTQETGGHVVASHRRSQSDVKGASSKVQRVLRALLLGPPNCVWVLLWDAFLACTIVLFMRPWFLFSYHKELRVLVPGPVNKFVMAHACGAA